MLLTNPFLYRKTLRLEATSRAVTVVPNAARLLHRRRIAAQPATATLTAPAASLSRTRVILAQTTPISIAGTATLKRKLLLKCLPATISLATSAAILQRIRLAGFIKADITIAPQPALLLRRLVLKALPASIATTPRSANFLRVAATIEAQSQSIVVAGRTADIRASRLLTAAPAGIVVTPRSAQLVRSYPLSVQPAAIVVTPQPAILRVSRVLKAVKQDIAIAPKLVDLSASMQLAWTDSEAQSLADTLTANFPGESIGSAAAARYVVVMVSARGTGGASRTITGLTIGGVAASLLVASASISNPTAIFGLLVPGGTTANVVVTASGVMSRCSIGVGTIDRYLSSTPTDAATTTATSTSIALPLAISAGGVGFWCVSTAAVGDVAWANATEQYDLTPGTVFRGSAATYKDGAGSMRTGTASWSGSQSVSMCAVSWR